ncbi:MAG: response regulator [Deltaproteobacteria bacterium]|nr:response regulator [Deltaproteobacteria bacterium]
MGSSSRILVVDGDEADRTRVLKTLAADGYELDEAPDGVEAFEKLLAIPFDLIVTEAKLAKLDGPDLITKLRGHGVKTPIVVLTSVTKAATLAGLMKLGIVAYLHKSSPPELLCKKVGDALPRPAEPGIPAEAASTVAVSTEGTALAGGRVLVIDAMEIVHERSRALFPPAVQLDCCSTIKDGLARAHNGVYRMVLFDSDASVLNLPAIVDQLHLLQPEAPVVAIAAPSKKGDDSGLLESLRPFGFDDVLFKPFQAKEIALFVEQYCTTWDELVTVRDDVVRVSRLRCRADHRDRYVTELFTRLQALVKPLSDACFDRAIVDMTHVDKLLPTEVADLVSQLQRAGSELGVTFLVAVNQTTDAELRGFTESFDAQGFRYFTSVAAARAHMDAAT